MKWGLELGFRSLVIVRTIDVSGFKKLSIVFRSLKFRKSHKVVNSFVLFCLEYQMKQWSKAERAAALCARPSSLLCMCLLRQHNSRPDYSAHALLQSRETVPWITRGARERAKEDAAQIWITAWSYIASVVLIQTRLKLISHPVLHPNVMIVPLMMGPTKS